jgi:aromatase
MTEIQRVTHRATTKAPAAAVYDLVADVRRWPVLFGPTIHVDVLEHDDRAERFTIWALVNDKVINWTSRRTFDPARSRITFRQEHSSPPIASMTGTWEFVDHGPAGTELLLHHEFSTVDGSAESAAKITRALDANSTAELGAIRRIAELGHPIDDLVCTFDDAIKVSAPAKAAYAFVDQARKWPYRLPHVADVRLTEEEAGVQHMTMETVTADGSSHTTSSIRVCAPGRRIVYKQTRPPAGLLGHAGGWLFDDRDDGGSLLTSRHMIMLDPAADHGGSPAAARAWFTEALRANSRTTMRYAKKFAEEP